MFAYFVEFKTFTITVPVCPELNFLLRLSLSNQSLKTCLQQTKSFKLRDTSSEILMESCQFTMKSNLTTVALECCAYV